MQDNEGPFNEPTGQIDGIDADALLNQIENGGQVEPAAPAAKEPAAAQETVSQDFEFDYGEKKIKVPYSDPRLKQWAVTGYGWREQAEALRQEQEKFAQERAKYEQESAQYKAINQYAIENPGWFEHILDAWNNRKQDPQTAAQIPKEIQDQLKELTQFKQSFEEKQRLETVKQEDTALESEIKSIREQYKDLDWDSPDEKTGMSLEQRVIQHGLSMGLNGSKPGHFRAAFRDYNHEHLLKLQEERGKESAIKEKQRQTKLGLLGSSPTPTKGLKPAENLKTKSYDDLEREAKAEYDIA